MDFQWQLAPFHPINAGLMDDILIVLEVIQELYMEVYISCFFLRWRLAPFHS